MLGNTRRVEESVGERHCHTAPASIEARAHSSTGNMLQIVATLPNLCLRRMTVALETRPAPNKLPKNEGNRARHFFFESGFNILELSG
jgi:hypothetical protein